MPDPGEKKEAKLRQYKKTVKDYKKENFREKEKKKSDQIYWDCWTKSKSRWYD